MSRRWILVVIACAGGCALERANEVAEASAGASESHGADSDDPTSMDMGDLGEGPGDGDGDPDEEPDCAALVYAPQPTVIDGLPTVAIDILELDAALEFDAQGHGAHAHGSLRFALGDAGGMPYFDLRQTPETLALDGRPLPVEALARHDFGAGFDFGFSILEVALEPCSVHELEFAYALTIPDAPGAAGLSFTDDRVEFDLFSSDLNPGRYLEAWLPANMPWDRHPISLGVSLEGTTTEHRLISNAAVDDIAPHSWQLEFPASSTTMDPMLLLLPADELSSQTGVHQAINGQLIPFAVHVDAEVATSTPIIVNNLGSYLDSFVLALGEFGHPAMTVYVYPSERSMEYAGATTSTVDALEHEVFHSWWARGLSPATYADGWIDEAWAMFATGWNAYAPVTINWNGPPTRLFDPHPFARDTPHIAYSSGRLLFAGLADLMGVAPLQAAMHELYASLGPIGSLSTAQLERHLYCASGELPEVRQAFHRFVYGLDGEVAPAPARACAEPP